MFGPPKSFTGPSVQVIWLRVGDRIMSTYAPKVGILENTQNLRAHRFLYIKKQTNKKKETNLTLFTWTGPLECLWIVLQHLAVELRTLCGALTRITRLLPQFSTQKINQNRQE